MSKTQKSQANNYLRLVVNAKNPISQSTESITKEGETEQLEMFEQPNAICFVAARNLTFEDVKQLIERYRFHHIVDIRDVPYLNFGRSSRDVFFQYLSDRAVDYLSLFSLATSKRKSSVNDLFDDSASEYPDLTKELSDWILQGPTLVLTSKQHDDDVATNFSKFLKKSEIGYSEIAN